MFSMVNSTDPFLGIFLVISGMVHYWVYDAMFVAIVQIHSETVTLNHAKTVPRKKNGFANGYVQESSSHNNHIDLHGK